MRFMRLLCVCLLLCGASVCAAAGPLTATTSAAAPAAAPATPTVPQPTTTMPTVPDTGMPVVTTLNAPPHW